MDIRTATIDDLPAIVDIYNAAIPGRMATADTQPVSVESRRVWFEQHRSDRRPLWVACEGPVVGGWLSVRDFYGRPAYHATAECGLYVAPAYHRRGIGRLLLRHGIAAAPSLGLRTLLGFVFAHNEPSIALLRGHGFETWGHLPRIAELDGLERDLLIFGRRV